MDVSLAEELLLIAYNGETGKASTGAAELDCGLAGAVLVELTLAGRIDVVDRKVRVVNAAPSGVPLIDGVLERIARERKARKPEWWVAKLRRDVRQRVLVPLVQRGVLREDRHRVMGLFSVRRYPSVDPATEAAARARLGLAMVKGAAPEPRTAALASLLHACGLSRKVFPELDRRELKARMKQIDEGQWAVASVRKAIQSIHSAVAASTVAATSVAATSS
ncbi:MAG: GPP34 family phosphoprotein [Pseudonocardiales bacterium]|nr:MAG: GPP34 family phosphoprotein [Pseudonocardiales bacterium]